MADEVTTEVVVPEVPVEEVVIPTPEPEQPKVDDEEKRKNEQLENLNAAIAQANDELRTIRAQKREAKEETPDLKVDLNDPNAQAWDKHIADKVSPVQAELDAEKREVRTFALQSFLADKPVLSQSPEKVKELVALYEKIRTATERTPEGVIVDLKRAYAALHADTLIAAAHNDRVDKVKAEAAQLEEAATHGGSSYQAPRKVRSKLSDDDKSQLAKWGITEEQWHQDQEKYGQ